jgi:hypothetical protein
VTISSPTIIAGATGRSRAQYSSVRYSAFVFAVILTSISYLLPNLGISCENVFTVSHWAHSRKNELSAFPIGLIHDALILI